MIDIDSAYGICLTGTYEEYYANGQIKVSGTYKAGYDTINIPLFDSLGNLLNKSLVKKPTSKKMGIWEYYSPSGELLRREYH